MKREKNKYIPNHKIIMAYMCVCVCDCVCYVKVYQEVNMLTVILLSVGNLGNFYSFLCFSVFFKIAIIRFSTDKEKT